MLVTHIHPFTSRQTLKPHCTQGEVRFLSALVAAHLQPFYLSSNGAGELHF